MLLKKLVTSYYHNVWNKRDYRLLPYLFNDNCRVNYISKLNNKTVVETPEDIRRNIKTWVTLFPNIKITIKNIISDDHHVSAYCELTGTHTGECLNVAPTGKIITIEMLDFYKIEGGKITEQCCNINVFDALEQLQMMNENKAIKKLSEA